MSLDVSLVVSGDLEHPRNRDLAEHLCKLVREAVQSAARDEGENVAVGPPKEQRITTEIRAFDGFDPFEKPAVDRSIVQTASIKPAISIAPAAAQ